MKKEVIKNDKLFRNMCRRKQLSEYTKRAYITVLTEYCTLTGKTPSELRTEAYKEQMTIPDKLLRSINTYLEDYLDSLEDRKLMNSSIRSKMSKIRAFYNEYDIDLPKPIKFKRDKVIKRGSDIVTMEHVRKAVNSTPNFKYKAMITLLASSGMRSTDMRLLKVQDFINATKDYHDKEDVNDVIKEIEGRTIVPCWDFYSEKTDVPTITFNTPECTEHIITYLKQRDDLKNDQFLFCPENTNGYIVYHRTSIILIFKKINDRLSFGQLPNSYHFFRAHKLRSFFASILNKNSVPYAVYKKMMGQTMSGVDTAYIKISKETCKQEYMRCINDLTTEKVEIKKVTSDEIKSIVEENKKLREDVDEIIKNENELNPVIEGFMKDPKIQRAVKNYMARQEK